MQNHSTGEQRWCFSNLENIPSLLLLLLPLPFKLLAGAEVIFPVCPKCFGICLSRAHGCDVTNPVCLHPQSTPPLHLSGVPAVLPGHSSLCAFPHFQDFFSLLMPLFRSAVLMGTATVCVTSDQGVWKELLLGCSAVDEHLGRPIV